MQTLPKYNLVTLIVFCHLHQKTLKCTNCGSTHYWGHGWYFRKGTHFVWAIIPIKRYLCQRSSCKKSFSLKPFPILPYTRFSLWHLIQIDELIQSGCSSEELAACLQIRHAIILRVKSYLTRMQKFIEQESRILGHFPKAGLFSQWIEVLKVHSWFEITKRYFHSLYPLRYIQSSPHTIR